MASRQNASSKQDASGEAKLPKKGPKGRAVDKAAPAKDAELVLYEFIAMLVRISFWRANPYPSPRPSPNPDPNLTLALYPSPDPDPTPTPNQARQPHPR